jgi:predicted amidohydrolase YtcJ
MIGLSLSNIDHVPSIGGSCVETPYPREAKNFPLWKYQFYGPHGVCTLTSPDYNDADFLRAAAKYGFRISGMHSGGDRGVNTFLELVEKLAKEYPDIVERRWVIDHCRYVTAEQAKRAKNLGIIFSCGPKYIYDGELGDVGAYSIIYGEKTAADVVVPLRTLLDSGARTTLQLDQHGFHPFLALQVAVTRKDVTGKVWGPQQRVTRREALYMYTRWAAEYVLRENQLGSIQLKKYADFVVLSQDYLTVPEDQIGMIDPLLTVVGGRIVYTQAEFAASAGLPQVGFQEKATWWKRGTPEEAAKARARAGASE